MRRFAAAVFGLTLSLPGVAWADNEPCRGENACQGRQKKGCAEAQAQCEDNDNVVIILCPQPGSCTFEDQPN